MRKLTNPINFDDKIPIYNFLDLWEHLDLYHLIKVIEKHRNIQWEIILSKLEFKKKSILIKELRNLRSNLGVVHIVGDGVGLLSFMMAQRELFNYERICSIDTNPNSVEVADNLNKKFVIDGWRFKAIAADPFGLNYDNESLPVRQQDGKIEIIIQRPDVIINPSCEQFSNFHEWRNCIPNKKFMALQRIRKQTRPQEVDSEESLSDFKAVARFGEHFYAGTFIIEDSIVETVIGTT
jgi:SAM-dependent methyltransferase